MIDIMVPEDWLIEVIPHTSVNPWMVDCTYWGVTNHGLRLIRQAGGHVKNEGRLTNPQDLRITFPDEATAALFKLTHL